MAMVVVAPGRIPVTVVYVDDARPPVEPAGAPSPVAKAPDPDCRTIADAHIAVGIAVIDNIGIVDRDVDVLRTHREDRDIRTVGDLHAVIGDQVPELAGGMTQPLDCRHHFVLLHDDRIAELVGPGRILGHHGKNRREGNQGLHAGIVGQLRPGHRVREFLTREVAV